MKGGGHRPNWNKPHTRNAIPQKQSGGYAGGELNSIARRNRLNASADSKIQPHPKNGRLFLGMGILSAALGPVIYAVQFHNHNLGSPWYVPALATLGVVLIALAAGQSRSVWHHIAAGLATLFATFVWLMYWVVLAAPSYSGSVEIGRAFPNFETKLAGGRGFSQMDLQSEQDTILLFFRGRW
jgi:hypothetical protein